MLNLIVIDTPELKAVSTSKAEQIKNTFLPMTEMLSQMESKFEEIVEQSKLGITSEICENAKKLRIQIGKIRIETGKAKDKQKENIKLEDKAIMGVHNILVWAVKEKEDKLRDIENFFEIQEQERLQGLQNIRVALLEPYFESASELDLSSMEQDVFEAYLEVKKKNFGDLKKAEAEAERLRIEIEKEAELERIRKEKELKEAKAKAAKLEKEKAEQEAKIKAEREAQAEIQRQKNLEFERKLEQERRKAEAIRQAELKKEQEYKEKLLKAEQEAERQRKILEEQEAAKQAEIEKEFSKDDAAKIEDLILDLNEIKIKYDFKSKKNKKMYSDVQLLINKIVLHIQK